MNLRFFCATRSQWNDARIPNEHFSARKKSTSATNLWNFMEACLFQFIFKRESKEDSLLSTEDATKIFEETYCNFVIIATLLWIMREY